MLFDSHSHLHDEKFDSDRDEVIARAREAGVSLILTLGDTIAASRAAIRLAESAPEVLAAAGVHPCQAAEWNDDTAAELERLLDHPRVVVLGEIGLDYYWEKDPGAIAHQHRAFREQLAIARRRGFGVSIHCRDSNADVLADLKAERGAEIGGVLHCFAGSYEEARTGIDMGFFIGVGGTSTYPKSEELRAVLKKVGLKHLLVETDAPYLAPQPRRGKRNEPGFVAMTAERLAELFGVSVEEVARVTTANTFAAFRLKEKGLAALPAHG